MDVSQFIRRREYQNGPDRVFGKWQVIDVHEIPDVFTPESEIDFYCFNGQQEFLLHVRDRADERYEMTVGNDGFTQLFAETHVTDVTDEFLATLLDRFERLPVPDSSAKLAELAARAVRVLKLPPRTHAIAVLDAGDDEVTWARYFVTGGARMCRQEGFVSTTWARDAIWRAANCMEHGHGPDHSLTIWGPAARGQLGLMGPDDAVFIGPGAQRHPDDFLPHALEG